MKTHRFANGMTVCGARSGVDALDVDGEVTCRRCLLSPPEVWRGQHYERRDGRCFLVRGFADPALAPWRQGVRS